MQMWDEVSRAISWTMDNIRTYGGDAAVSLAGHSAGAQPCARALLQRAGVKNVPSKTNAREFPRIRECRDDSLASRECTISGFTTTSKTLEESPS